MCIRDRLYHLELTLFPFFYPLPNISMISLLKKKCQIEKAFAYAKTSKNKSIQNKQISQSTASVVKQY